LSKSEEVIEPRSDSERLSVSLEGFDGPLDLLLDLARAQKIDLAKISILQLVDQYLAVIDGARLVRLELAADWLVMAAWLTWLKSRLLLPKEDPGAAEAEVSADVLAARLAELNVMRAAGAWLSARPVLGQEVFARGAAENLIATDRSRISADLPLLLRAFLDAVRRGTVKPRYQPRQLSLWTVQDALKRLSASLPGTAGWSNLEQFLPANLAGRERNAAIASTLIASLEMAREGGLLLRQTEAFAPIEISPVSSELAFLVPSDEALEEGNEARAADNDDVDDDADDDFDDEETGE